MLCVRPVRSLTIRHGPGGGLLLGTVQHVVVARVLVVLQIDGDGLGVDDVGDVVGDHLAHRLTRQGAQEILRAAVTRPTSAGEDDEHGDVPESGALVLVAAMPLRDSVHDVVQEEQADKRQQTLPDRYHAADDGPPRSGIPHQTQGAPDVQSVLDAYAARIAVQL